MATHRNFVLLLAFLPVSLALIGYDCAGKGLNITTLSLLDIGDCQIEDIEPNKEEVYLQLMQISEYDFTDVIQCKVEVDRIIFYCGMHSHVSVVHNGRKAYIHVMSANVCRQLQESGMLYLGGDAQLAGLKKNSTDTRSIMLAGSAGVDGKCHGTQYSDPYGTWTDVVVQASVKVTLRNFRAPINIASGEIILPSGLHCKVSEEGCLDVDGGESFWSPVPIDSCHFNQYDVLYEGNAYKLTPKPNQSSPTIYTVTTRDTTFALTKTSEINVCGYKLTRTEHPKLLILETQRERTFKIKSKVAVDNLDIFSYVNSKFIYVEKHLKTQLTQLYRDIMEQKCALEKQILKNALSLSSIAPDEMAFRIMKAPGHTAVTAGEVIHLIKCVPVECSIRQTQECFNELPVTCQNRTYFLSPRSRVLTRNASPRDCSELLPAMYQIHGTWFRLMPRPVETLPPTIIEPLTKPKWKYVNPSDLASSGIYSTQDLDRLRNHIMFPVEKPSMLNTLARGAMGHTIPVGSVSMINLMDEDSINKIADNAGYRVWEGFITFGSASAGVLGIILIFRIAKLVIDTLIHGYALHSVYGWSIHLLGALWSSITHLLLHLATPRQIKERDVEAGSTGAEDQPPSPEPPQPAARHLPSPSAESESASARPSENCYSVPSYTQLRKILNEN